MPTNVTDPRSNANDQIDHAVRVIGRSRDRLAVFEAIYHGKGRKTPDAIAERANLPRKRVLEEAVKLAKQHIIVQEKDPKRGILYGVDSFYDANKGQIVRLVKDPKKLARLPTKTRPDATTRTARFDLPKRQLRARMITVDDIDSFAAVRKATPDGTAPLPEAQFKSGIASILGEKGRFTDWGGERNDLYTTTLKLNGRRLAAAFAFKGPATSGSLTPKKMGKNGDQIQRLFQSPASVFVVQYWGQIDQSVVELMEKLAQLKSYMGAGEEVWFGIIDAADSARLVAAYDRDFKVKKGAK